MRPAVHFFFGFGFGALSGVGFLSALGAASRFLWEMRRSSRSALLSSLRLARCCASSARSSSAAGAAASLFPVKLSEMSSGAEYSFS